MELKLKKIPQKKKLMILIMIGVFGIFLVIIGSAGGKKTNAQKNNGENTESNATLAYIENVENKIRTITRQITGSDSAVIVTVSEGIKYVYVSNEKSADGKTEHEYITVRNESGAGEMILQKEIYPAIEGVSVVCRGGDNPLVQSKLISVISTALGLPSNRICIAGAK